MSTTNTAPTKRSFKFMEIPLNKFKNEAVPYHQEILLKHKTNIHKLTNVGDYEQLDREVKDKKRCVRQLKELMYELDTLRSQVEDSDLDKFDSKTLALRKIILELVKDYADIETETKRVIEECSMEDNDNVFLNSPQLQIQDDTEALKLHEFENQLRQYDMLNNDIEDVHDIFVNLNQMVGNQKEKIDIVELNTEVAHDNVKGGLLQLIKAAKLQKASYPVAGAFIGTLVGGPIGSVAGLKIGCIAGIGCGLAGYVGGRFFKKVNNAELETEEVELKTADYVNASDNRVAITTATDKKNI